MFLGIAFFVSIDHHQPDPPSFIILFIALFFLLGYNNANTLDDGGGEGHFSYTLTSIFISLAPALLALSVLSPDFVDR